MKIKGQLLCTYVIRVGVIHFYIFMFICTLTFKDAAVKQSEAV